MRPQLVAMFLSQCLATLQERSDYPKIQIILRALASE